MSQVIRVSLPTYNAFTETDPDHFALYSDEDWVLIKELVRGAGTCEQFQTQEITHNLGYIPFYLVYCQIASGQFQLSFSYNIFDDWRCSVDATKLYINNNASPSFTTFRYYIFYDHMRDAP